MKAYQQPKQIVNSNLSPCLRPEDFSRFDGNVVTRLIGKVSFEPYRKILERAVFKDRQNRRQSLRAQRLPTLFDPAELPPGDPSKVNLYEDSRGRPALDPVLMAEVICLGRLLNISDAALSLGIAECASFQLFLRVPPGTFISRQVIWEYREIFRRTEVFQRLAVEHVDELTKEGLISNDKDNPLIIDGSFVEVPIQHNTKAETKLLKAGVPPKDVWPGEENKHKVAHKDGDATWTKKNGKSYFGYKIAPLVESMNKFMIYATIVPAHVHDSKLTTQLLSEEDAGRKLLADAAWDGQRPQDETRSFGVIPDFCVKGHRNHPLTQAQREENRVRARTRSRIEHTFGFLEKTMGRSWLRYVGIKRAICWQWLTVLCYNICREEIVRRILT